MNESRSLNTILTLTKVAKVLSIIVLVLCVVAAISSLVTFAFASQFIGSVLPESWQNAFEQLDPTTLNALNATGGPLDPENMTGWLSKAAISFAINCTGGAVVAFLAYRYFKNVLAAETPFTFKGADELKNLGIVVLAVALGVSFIGSIITGGKLSISLGGSFAPGIAFLVVSVIFRHGAELRERAENASPALPFGGEL